VNVSDAQSQLAGSSLVVVDIEPDRAEMPAALISQTGVHDLVLGVPGLTVDVYATRLLWSAVFRPAGQKEQASQHSRPRRS
jgi:hypothetical protein